MRPALKFGIPAAAGLSAAAYSAMDDGTPLESVGAGVGGALGGAAGLLAARGLAGKYAPTLIARAKEAGANRADALLEAGTNVRDGGLRQQALVGMADGITDLTGGITQRGIGKAAAAGLVPASAAGAALGGMAAGQAVGAVGQMMGIDPEMPGSSNTVNSRLSMQSAMLPMY